MSKPDGPKVEEIEGCRVVYGAIPLNLMPKLLKGMPKSAKMDIRAGNLLGAMLVIGTDENLSRLIEVTPRREVPEPWAEKVGAGACKWAAEGEIGSSSNFVLQRLTGFNALEWLHRGNLEKEQTPAYPRDPSDLRRIRLLLEAQPDLAERLSEVAVTPQLKGLVSNWDEICSTMDEETPDWRQPFKGSKSPKTYELLKDLVENAKVRSPSP